MPRLRFGLHIPSFSFAGAPSTTAVSLAAVAADAEAAGFGSVWVMDHFRQIPHVGRPWEDMLEAYTTLGYLAAHTSRVRLGTLVTGITYRNIGLVAKLVATLDVLSEGRAVCGLGAAWHEEEHRAWGWDFPPVSDRYSLLEDALSALPVLWGKGAPPFAGRAVTLPETLCYPRPLQDHVPVLVGGSGEKRTLALVARHADACNLFGDPKQVRHKLSVLASHCAAIERPVSTIHVTHLSTSLVAPSPELLVDAARAITPRNGDPSRVARRSGGRTTDGAIERYAALADVGVETAIVSLADLGPDPGAAIRRFAPVIAAFDPTERAF